jgi:hypothetical protein
MAIERINQPRPAHTSQQWVCHHLWIEIGSGKGDASEGALPSGIAGRVVEQDKTTTAYIVTVRHDIGGDRRRVRSNALRRRELLDLQLGAPRRGHQVLNGPTKRVRGRSRVAVGCHPMSVCGCP